MTALKKIVSRLAPFPRERFLAFLEHLKILSKDEGLVPIQLLGTQSYLLDEICKAIDAGQSHILILKARQLGISTFFIALDLFWIMEHPGILGSFVTHEDKSKAQFRNIIQVFFANLPARFKIGFRLENRDMLVLKNNSLLAYLVAGIKEKSKGGLGRSSANNFIHCTEVAFWGNEEDLQEISATMSSHHPHRMRIEETTANGFNFFEERWRNAKDDPSIACIFVGWWRHDHYRFDDDDPRFLMFMPQGHETPLHIRERKGIKQVRDQYGIEITRNQIAWYRWELETENQGDQSKMDENFPFVEDDAFQATGSNFFTSPTLTDAMRRARQQAYMPFKYVMSERWQDTQVIQTKDRRGELKIWEEPYAGGHYVIGCDPAYGSSEAADRAVVNVSRCFADRIVQVAEFVTPVFSTYQCAWVLCHLAGYYRNCRYNLEINGPGEAVDNEVRRLRMELRNQPFGNADNLRDVLAGMKVFLYGRNDAIRGGPTAYNWRTTGTNKPVMLSGLKDAFELRKYLINSMPLLEEMKTIVIDDGVICAQKGKKDDRVMAAALAFEAWRKWTQPYLKNMGLTFELQMKEQLGLRPDQANNLAINYLKAARILVDERAK